MELTTLIKALEVAMRPKEKFGGPYQSTWRIMRLPEQVLIDMLRPDEKTQQQPRPVSCLDAAMETFAQTRKVIRCVKDTTTGCWPIHW